MTLTPGDRAPDFTLPTAAGDVFSLEDTRADGHNVLVVFLRHLG